MNRDTVTLTELRQLAEGLEAGGASGLSTSDLAFLGATLKSIANNAKDVLEKVQAEVSHRLDEREAKVLFENGSSIERKFANNYDLMDRPRLFELVLGIDVAAARDLFTFKPEEVIPAHVEVNNTTKLKNWIEKLGIGEQREALTAALGAQPYRPTFTYKAVDPETGEVTQV